MNLLRIDHVSLDVVDRARTLAWYEEVLGLWGGRPGPADEPMFLGPAGSRLAFFDRGAAGLRHVALATDPAGQRRVRDRLEQFAIPYRMEQHRASHSMYFTDVDGATLEVMVPTR